MVHFDFKRPSAVGGGFLDELLIGIGIGSSQMVVEMGDDQARSKRWLEQGEDLQQQQRIVPAEWKSVLRGSTEILGEAGPKMVALIGCSTITTEV